MKIYGLVNIVGACLLGFAALPVSLLRVGHGRAAALALCLTLEQALKGGS